ncbi:hypothetical protein GC176_00635 [bacterium]|nr:hypothetical protein [bacterium]
MAEPLVEVITLTYPKHRLSPEDLLTFVEMPGFWEDWQCCGRDDEDLHTLQITIMAQPDVGTPISGAERLCEVHCQASPESETLMTVRYVYFEEYSMVLLVIAFNGHNVLTEGEKAQINALIDRQDDELSRRSRRI